MTLRRPLVPLLSLLLLVRCLSPVLQAQEVRSDTGNSITTPAAGLMIARSTKIQPGEYLLPAPGDQPLIRIRGNDLTVDFDGCVLRGSPADADPDTRSGTAILIEGSNITLRNLSAHGYKIAVFAKAIDGLQLEGCDLSYNYRQRLRSTPDAEDLADWLSYHHNDQDEWLRYGAAIYLSDCNGFTVRDCRATGGQNGLLLNRCNRGRVWNNRFHFLSGVGIGLYRSGHNAIMHNSLDWCVRGYSHGVYSRGQDSAGILVYEQSSNNLIAYNSATHSGDGLFLWAGQQTMDSGWGGCNDNLIYGNDFSHAPANGIEMTFSRNFVVHNRIDDCDYGLWGGYSHGSLLLANRFRDNRVAIAIEHGQYNQVLANALIGGEIGVSLWMNDRQDPSWGYPQVRATSSRNYLLAGNWFEGVKTPVQFRRTTASRVANNAFVESGPSEIDGVRLEMQSKLNQVELDQQLATAFAWTPPPVEGAIDATLPKWHPRGRRFIVVDEWGPYDFRSPRLVLCDRNDRGQHDFEILGPPGDWRVVDAGSLQLTPTSGKVPGELRFNLPAGKAIDLHLQLEYTGAEVVSINGVKSPAGTPVRFGLRRFYAPIDWDIRWYRFDEAADPRTAPEAFKQVLTTQPVHQEQAQRLAYAWVGSPGPNAPSDRFATVASGAVEVPRGRYVLSVTSDDGVRVWVDDKLVIDNWTWHSPTTDRAEVELDGKHRLRVEHFELDGFATLKVDLQPKR